MLSFLPEFSLFNLRIKKISLLQDIVVEKINSAIHVDSVNQISGDTLKTEIKKKPFTKRKKGSLEVEDFGTNNLSIFFESLQKSKSEPIRIAFFGDSFIEGDILVAPLRDTLQSLFGGRGVGFVPIASEISGFRTSIRHTFENWQTYSMIGVKDDFYPPGMSGYSFKPLSENYFEYKPGYDKKLLPAIKVFYKSKRSASLSASIANAEARSFELVESDTIQEFIVPGKNYDRVKISCPNFEHLILYGAAIEDSVGISIDNFSMRSNPGLALATIPDEMFQQFNRLRHYKLVILQYGLNVVNENDSTGYKWYEEKMVGLIRKLKTLLPESSFMLLGVSDRCTKQGNEMKTMPGVYILRDVQRRIAYRCEIAFWDLFEGMGGENTMVKFTEANPPLGAKDYTHLTFRGGKKIAIKFANALLKQKKKYEKR
jgi:hypothetical protein